MSQPRLPGTVASPKQAREHLIAAKARVRTAEANFATAKEAVRELRGFVTSAEGARRAAEDDLEAEGSAANDAAHGRALDAKAAAVANLAGGVRARDEARRALSTAEAERARADEELQAARAGRRTDVGKAIAAQATGGASD